MDETRERLLRVEGNLRGVAYAAMGDDELDAAIHEQVTWAARIGWEDGYSRADLRARSMTEPAAIPCMAAERFPLPPRKVLREEPDPHGYGEWRFKDGRLEWRDSAAKLLWTDPRFVPSHGPVTVEPSITAERCVLVADLLANPYREEPQ